MNDNPVASRLPRALAQAWETAGSWLRFVSSTPLSTRKKKPTELVYGVDDVPPPITILLIGMQHVGVVRIQLIYPLLVIQLAGLPTASSVKRARIVG